MIITLFLLFSSCNGIANPICGGFRYKCGTDNQPNVCLNVSDYQGKVHDLQLCSSDQECLYSKGVYGSPVYCSAKNVTISILPGEYCSSNTDCLSGSCISGVCKGLTTGQQCTTHQQCDVGFFCNGYCQPQVQYQSACLDDYWCTNNCVCSKGLCSYYYSLANNVVANNSLACLYGYVHPNGTCQIGPSSQIKLQPCEADSECLLLDPLGNLFGYGSCQCGFNAGGFSYCALSQGDSEYLQIIHNFKWILQVNQQCHTSLRYGPCHALYTNEVNEYQRSVQYYNQAPQVTFNDACIRSLITYSYWGIYSQLIVFSWIIIYI